MTDNEKFMSVQPTCHKALILVSLHLCFRFPN